MRIFIAAPIVAVDRIKTLARAFELRGYEIASSWHRIVTADTIDPETVEERRAILNTNLRELDAADVVYAHTWTGEPRTTFGEISWALCRGKPVVWSVPPGSASMSRYLNLFAAHPLVTVCTTIDHVLPALAKIAEGGG